MNRKTKRHSLLLITVLLIFCFLPVTVMRTEAANTGYCGSNCKWTVDGSTITFSQKTFFQGNSKTGAIDTSDLTSAERTGITKAVFGTAIVEIGQNTLEGFSNIKTVEITSAVCNTIGKEVFYNLAKLEKVDMGKSLVSIGEQAFRLCTSLKTITFPDTVTTIEKGAFWSSGLEEAKLPANLVSLGESAFQACKSLKSVKISGKLKTIPKQCFYSCDRLLTVDIAEGVETIDTSAFQFCSGLYSVGIPSTVVSIGNAVFSGCTKLGGLDLSHVTSLGRYSVADCLGIGEIRLSNVLKNVDNQAFLNNYTNKKVIFDGTREEFAKIANKEELKNTDLLTGTVEYLQSSSNLPTVEDIEKRIKTLSGKAEVPGASFSTLRARASRAYKKRIQLKWKAVPGASGYIIYGAERKEALVKLETIKNAGTTTYTHNYLKPNKYYRYVVVAYQNVGSGKEDLRVLSCSPVIIAATLGGKYRNTQAVTFSSKKISLKKGKKQKLGAALVSKASIGKKYRTFLKMRYESSDPAVATVSRNGRIKAVSKGTCYVFAYAQDGIFKRIKVTVQ